MKPQRRPRGHRTSARPRNATAFPCSAARLNHHRAAWALQRQQLSRTYVHTNAVSDSHNLDSLSGQVFGDVLRTNGPQGLFNGIVPRMGLGIWQTLFMVTGARLLKEKLDGK